MALILSSGNVYIYVEIFGMYKMRSAGMFPACKIKLRNICWNGVVTEHLHSHRRHFKDICILKPLN